MKYVVTQIDPLGNREEVVHEVSDLTEAMTSATKLRRKIPHDWCVQIYEKPDYLRMRKYLKKRDEKNGGTTI